MNTMIMGTFDGARAAAIMDAALWYFNRLNFNKTKRYHA